MSKVYEFDPQVYPLKLWVVVKPTIEQLHRRFAVLDGDDNFTQKEIDDSTIKPYWGACRLTVVEKATGKNGSLVIMVIPKECDDSTICHEVSHAYDDFVDLLGIPPVGETRAYLQEWMFRKCQDVMKKKIR